MALRTLGFGSIGQFAGLMKELLGSAELTGEEIEAMADGMAGNERKLAAVPFDVDRGQILKMVKSACAQP